jgi:hypothetical protein
MHFKQPQIIYTNRWRNLQCSGGGDERRRRRDGQRGDETRWAETRGQRREGVGDKNEMGIGKPKPKRFEMVYIYYQNGVILGIHQCPKRRPLGSQVSFFLNIYIYIYIKAVSGYL